MNSVLIVDDDPDILDMVSLVLKTNNLRVNCINNGADLLPAIHKSKPDVVLMDIYLGDVDGRDLCNSLKASDMDFSGSCCSTTGMSLVSAGFQPVSNAFLNS